MPGVTVVSQQNTRPPVPHGEHCELIVHELGHEVPLPELLVAPPPLLPPRTVPPPPASSPMKLLSLPHAATTLAMTAQAPTILTKATLMALPFGLPALG